MAVFLVWVALWAAGGIFGPVKYHPPQPAPGSQVSIPVEHEANGR
jgi:hypothetical protein